MTAHGPGLNWVWTRDVKAGERLWARYDGSGTLLGIFDANNLPVAEPVGRDVRTKLVPAGVGGQGSQAGRSAGPAGSPE